MKVLKIRKISKRWIKPNAWVYDEEWCSWVQLPF